MKDPFIPYSIALIAEEKGFYEYYDNSETIFGAYFKRRDSDRIAALDWYYAEYDQSFQQWDRNALLSAPTHQQLIDWFREKHKLYIEILYNGSESYYWTIRELKPFGRVYDGILTDEKEFNIKGDYYECVNKAIKEALNLVITSPKEDQSQ